MVILFVILIVVASVVLGFVVLVQNPKGGGLAGNIGGLSNQFMGVKQTTDVLEKGTWIFAAVIALLCIFSAVFIPTTVGGKSQDYLKEIKAPQTTQPATPAAQPSQGAVTPAAPTTNPEKK